MRLFASTASPYARLIRVMIYELNLQRQVSIEWVNPWHSAEKLVRVNPFSRVPALETESGTVITEALSIADWLTLRFSGGDLIAPGAAASTTYSKLGLGAGALDASVAIVTARRLDSEADSHPMTRRRFDALERAIPKIARAVGEPDSPDLGDFYIAIALEYLDFRISDFDWRGEQSWLDQWLTALANRPSMAATRPHD